MIHKVWELANEAQNDFENCHIQTEVYNDVGLNSDLRNYLNMLDILEEVNHENAPDLHARLIRDLEKARDCQLLEVVVETLLEIEEKNEAGAKEAREWLDQHYITEKVVTEGDKQWPT
jgi:hypothetical protein